MKKIIATLLIAALALSAVFAGGSSDNDPNSKGTIGILMPTLGAEFFTTTANRAAEILQAEGYKTNIQSFENDAAQAVTCIENFIIDGVKAIAYMTVDTAGDDALRAAMDAGVGVIICGVETKNYDVCEIADNYINGYKVGETAAKYIEETFGGSTQIGVIGSTLSQNMIDRTNGIKDALRDKSPDSTIVFEGNVGSSSIGSGTAYAENLNTLYPDCQVVVSYSDTFSSEVAEIFKALNYPSTAAIFGHDGEAKVLADIAAGGYIKGTLDLGDPGQQMADATIKYLNGEYESGTLRITPAVPVTPENIGDFYPTRK